MPKRILQGHVVQTATDKTIRVRVERKYRHPLYGKYVRSSKHYLAHDEENVAVIGDTVRIQESRPISRRKTWRMLERFAGKGIGSKQVPSESINSDQTNTEEGQS